MFTCKVCVCALLEIADYNLAWGFYDTSFKK